MGEGYDEKEEVNFMQQCLEDIDLEVAKRKFVLD